MEIEAYFYASLARHLPKHEKGKALRVSAAPGSTAKDLLAKLGVPEKEVKIAFVNGIRKDLDTQLSDGDRVGFFPPVGGG